MHCGYRSITLDHAKEEVSVANVSLFDRPPSNEISMTCCQVVHYDRQVSHFVKVFAAMASDISSAANHQNRGIACSCSYLGRRQRSGSGREVELVAVRRGAGRRSRRTSTVAKRVFGVDFRSSCCRVWATFGRTAPPAARSGWGFGPGAMSNSLRSSTGIRPSSRRRRPPAMSARAIPTPDSV